jgi:hypothetical protein
LRDIVAMPKHKGTQYRFLVVKFEVKAPDGTILSVIYDIISEHWYVERDGEFFAQYPVGMKKGDKEAPNWIKRHPHAFEEDDEQPWRELPLACEPDVDEDYFECT